MSTFPNMPLRAHQQGPGGLVGAIAPGGGTGVTHTLAALAPGGANSLLPVLTAARLTRAHQFERISCIVPPASLRLQGEEAFADPAGCTALGRSRSGRAAANEPDPSGGLAGCMTA